MANNNPGPLAYTIPAGLNPPPAGQTGHRRGTVPNASTSAVTVFGTIPTGAVAVNVQVEAVDSANSVWVTMDGNPTASTAASTLGLQVPNAPSILRIPFRSGLASGTGINFIASVNGTHIQGFFEF